MESFAQILIKINLLIFLTLDIDEAIDNSFKILGDRESITKEISSEAAYLAC